MRKQHFLSTLVLSAVFALVLAVAPAEACRQHEAGLPESAATDGAIAQMIEATHGMTHAQRVQHIRALPETERKVLQDEVRALPADERKAFMKNLRQAFVDKNQRKAAQKQ